jgi:hypothetical protein
MAGLAEHAARTDVAPLRSWIVRHPIATFLVLVYATTTSLIFVPNGLTEPGLPPGGATPHGVLENVLGSAVPAFIVTALVSEKAACGTSPGAACGGGCRCAGICSACSLRC